MSVVSSLLPYLRGEMSKMRIPHNRDKVYKDECVYSFDSPYSDTGLYVNTVTFNGVGERFLHHDSSTSGCKLYLHQKWVQVPHVETEEEKSSEAPKKLAIGVEGGFMSTPKFDLITENVFVVLKSDGTKVSIPLPCAELPEFIANVLEGIITHEGMKKNMQVTTWEADQEKIVSKYADGLPQVNPDGLKIPQDPKLWKDAASDATENLWLNLSTGYIGGGRKLWDGSGGSGSALQHYIETGRKYPLVVKLGTITAHGADVWSYAEEEDRLVIDPHLAEHLSFWGIDIMKLEKSEKTLGEMEVDLNNNYDWSKLIEDQEHLVPLSGPGCIGLRNIGSSCYMNSALQCLISIPEIQQRYYQNHSAIVHSLPSRSHPATDISVQFSKLADALLSDKFVPPLSPAATSAASEGKTEVVSLGELSGDASLLEKYVVAPLMLKQAVGKEHPDFSSGRQQDVTEYLSYFLDVLQREERTSLARFDAAHAQMPTSSLFEFHVEDKMTLLDSNEVKISRPSPNTLRKMLDLPVPLSKAIRVVREEQEAKRARLGEKENSAASRDETEDLQVPFEACLEAWQGKEIVHLSHPSTGSLAPFLKFTRLKTFPRYLIVKLERYYVGDNWVQKKITAEVPMPLHLDLSTVSAEGVLSHEVELVETANVAAAVSAPIEPDVGLVAQLVSMGFSENGAKRAAIATNNADAETAMSWVFEHMGDADFNDPPVVTASDGASSSGSTPVDG